MVLDGDLNLKLRYAGLANTEESLLLLVGSNKEKQDLVFSVKLHLSLDP